MRIYLDNPVSGAMPWRFLCIFALLLFLTAVAMIALLIQQRRHRWLWARSACGFAVVLFGAMLCNGVLGVRLFADRI